MKRNKENKKKVRKPGEPIVIEFNLSKSVVITIAVIVLIATITTAKVVTIIIQGEESKTLANVEETSNERVTYVNSTTKDADGNVVNETDDNGNIVQVPVPKGYSASQIDGETTVSKGFVIYEGDVDWSTILVGDSENTETTTNTESVEATEKAETKPVEENIKTVDTITEENVTAETTTVEEKDASDNINDSDIENEKTTEDDTTANENDTTETTDTDSEADTTDGADTTEDETLTQQDINIFNLQKSRNQYVWVPVDDPSRIYGVDSNGKIWGKLYKFSYSGRTPLNWTETNGIMSITSKNGSNSYRDPDVLWGRSGYKYDTDGYSYMHQYGVGETRYEMLTQELEQNYYEIIESIKKYGGFYIGRYETGRLSGTVVVRKMNTDIAKQNYYYTTYKNCLALKGSNYNIKTTMITGSLWDETIEWLVKSGATNSEGTTLTYQLIGDSSTWGNYQNAKFKYIAQDTEIPIETENKELNSYKVIPTGSAEYTKANNIYDLAGNVMEWTTEAIDVEDRVIRGGCYQNHGSYSAGLRDKRTPSYYDIGVYGCRAILYIK